MARPAAASSSRRGGGGAGAGPATVFAARVVDGATLCYAWAFASLLLQWPGLFGPNGLQPVRAPDAAAAAAAAAWIPDALAAFAPPWLGVHEACELAVIAGTTLAVVAAATNVRNWAVMALLWALYGALQQRGRVFLSFQWDTLLLEVGFVSIWVATQRAPRAAIWSLRFLLFKLMLMSGVVKIQSNCPTWMSLSALDYHFATQCLPTPLAWYASALAPPALLRFSVAATLLIEIPGTALIIAPFRTARVLGFLMQTILQIGIMLTGNYNFFNILTVVLCISLLAPDLVKPGHLDVERDGPLQVLAAAIARADCSAAGAWLIATASLALLLHYSLAVFIKIETAYAVPLRVGLGVYALGLGLWRPVNQWVVAITSLAGVLLCVFAVLVEEMLGDRAVVTWQLSPTELESHVRHALPWILGYQAFVLVGAVALDVNDAVLETLGHLGAKRISHFFVSSAKTLGTLVTCAAFIFVACISAVPLASLDQPSIGRLIPSGVIWAFQHLQQPVELVHGYGLFRRMTGVGTDGSVARPEVVFEVQIGDEENWVEVDFLHKPGAVAQAPRFIIPHQPRLDWQMWFAALNTYQGAPWTVHLADKILRGSEPVLDLIPSLRELAREKRVQAVRAKRYSYAFTRNLSAPEWWVRDPLSERQYLPEIRPGDENVQNFLKAHGWRTHDVKVTSPVTEILIGARPIVEWIVRPEGLVAVVVIILSREMQRRRSAPAL